MRDEYAIGDIVQTKIDMGRLYEVNGVIHDQRRLFIFDRDYGGEREISFDDIDRHWVEL